MSNATKLGVYRHYKGGRYAVIMTAQNSTNSGDDEEMVIYVSLTYGTKKCRAAAEIHEMVLWPDGEMRSRFYLQEED
jgi:hypothetical protein